MAGWYTRVWTAWRPRSPPARAGKRTLGGNVNRAS